MPDPSSPPPSERFKAEMPQIPGVSEPQATKRSVSGGPWLVITGLLGVLIAVFVGGRLLSKPKRMEAPPPPPQIEVPVPAPDLTASIPIATEEAPVVAIISDFKPWRSKAFMFHNRQTGENVPALIVRLPIGSAAQSAGYWSFAMRPAYGSCQLDYIEDLETLKTDYGYHQARHPMVGNPCSRSLYDPLKYAPLPGNVLARGAIVQGSDLRPPLSIEIRLKGKNILATRME
jgi:hypothetical protein